MSSGCRGSRGHKVLQSPGETFSGLGQGDGHEDTGGSHRTADGSNMKRERSLESSDHHVPGSSNSWVGGGAVS